MQCCWQGLHDGIIDIDVTALMSLCLLLWSIFALMQKVVFLIPSSLYMISCAALKQNLNSFWAVTVILTISNTHPQCDIHSPAIPVVPLSLRQSPDWADTSISHLNHPPWTTGRLPQQLSEHASTWHQR